MPLNEKKNYSPFSKEFYIYKKGMSEEDAIKEAKSKRPCNKEYWMKKGFSEEESIQEVKNHQLKTNKKLYEKIKSGEIKRLTTAQKEYWIEKGMSEEDAIKKVSDRQKTFSKDKCIQKYGEEKGIKIWKERQDKWIKTLSEKSLDDKIIINKRKRITKENMINRYGEEDGLDRYKKWITNKKRIDSLKHGTSNESIDFFNKIIKELELDKYEIKIGKNNEYFITDDSFHVFYYDFTIEKLNLIIEYHGEKFHPNKNKLSKKEWTEWKQLYTNKSADLIYHKDEFKKNLALSNGFNFLSVFSNDEGAYSKTIEFIKKLL